MKEGQQKQFKIRRSIKQEDFHEQDHNCSLTSSGESELDGTVMVVAGGHTVNHSLPHFRPI